MALTEGDKAICGEIAQEIIEKVLKQHIDSCPHGKVLLKNRMFLIGCIIGASVGGGAGGAGIVMAFVRIFAGS